MRYLTNLNTHPYFNMAFDEYCLEKLAIDEPVFYLWQNCPSVIIGANQEVNSEVNMEYLEKSGIVLARRVTGGGAVYHDLGNLNYTMVGRSEDFERDYPEYTHYIIQALQTLGVPATLSGRNDIMVEGKKVSGFAKRVCKHRLMVHGTLMFDVNLDVLEQALCPPTNKLQSKGIASVRSRVTNLKEYLPQFPNVQAFKQQMERILSNHYSDEEFPLNAHDITQIQQLADDKFAQWEWIYGHSPRATLKHSAHLQCGMVEVNLSIAENRITECKFGGDFLGNIPTHTLEAAIIGIPYTYEAVNHCLSGINISQYFDRVSAKDIMNIIMGR